MAETASGTRPSVTQLILVPAIITLAVTILRLVGELQHWSPVLFGTGAGGGAGAIVGISWLPILFGPYFALKLAGSGARPAGNGKAIGLSLAGLAVMFLGAFVIFKGLKLGGVIAIVGFLIILGAAFVARAGWQALGTTLLAYAFAARVPVLIVMFIAMQAGWATHYSAVDPHFAQVPFWKQFLDTAILPQMFLWVGYTVVVGSIFGSITAAIARRGKQAAQVAS